MYRAKADVDCDGSNHADRIKRRELIEIVADEQHDDRNGGGDQGWNPRDAEAIKPHQRSGQFAVAGHEILNRDHAGDGRIAGGKQEESADHSHGQFAPSAYVFAGKESGHVFQVSIAIDRGARYICRWRG